MVGDNKLDCTTFPLKNDNNNNNDTRTFKGLQVPIMLFLRIWDPRR